MLFLIGVWGHGERVYAAVKFFLFTLGGSLLMLLAIIALYLLHGQQSGDYSFALEALKQTELGAWEPCRTGQPAPSPRAAGSPGGGFPNGSPPEARR